MRTVQYEPSMFRRWHDGPIVVIDAQCVYSVIDTDSIAYIAVNSISQIANYLNTIIRPFAGTFYIIAPVNDVAEIAQEFSDLDIVHVKL